MNTMLPIVDSLALLFGGVVLEKRLMAPGARRIPWFVSAAFILIAVIVNRFARAEWPLEGLWDLPRSVLVIGVLHAAAAWAWRRWKT